MSNKKVFSHYAKRFGIPLLSTVSGVKLDSFTIPELSNEYFLLTSKEIPGVNKIKTFSSSFPLLAEDYISYVGEPLLVLFGPDYESVHLLLDKIIVHTSPLETPPPPSFNIKPIEYERGKKNESENEREVNINFTYRGNRFSSPFSFKVMCDYNKEELYIECPTQCPKIVSYSIYKSALINMNNITLINKEYSSYYDECLFESVFSAVTTAIAAKKTLFPCEMKYHSFLYSDDISFSSKIRLDDSGNVKDEEINEKVNIGSYNIWGEEKERALLSSSMPLYDYDHLKINIESCSSLDPPTSFCGILPFTLSSVFNTLKMDVIAKERKELPPDLILNLYKDKEGLDKRINKALTISDYRRKYNTFSNHSTSFGLFDRMEGIGFSYNKDCVGISKEGLSKLKYSTKIVYKPNGILSIIGSIPSRIREEVLPLDYITNILSEKEKKPTIIFIDNSTTPCSSPDILYIYETLFPSVCIKAVNRIKERMKYEELPIEEEFSLENEENDEEAQRGDGISTCELYIDKLSLFIYVKSLILDLKVSAKNTKDETIKARTASLRVLKALKVKLDPDFKIKVNVKVESTNTSFSSSEALARILTLSSFSSALSLALGNKNSFTLPISAKEIEKIISGEKV